MHSKNYFSKLEVKYLEYVLQENSISVFQLSNSICVKLNSVF